MYPLYSTYHIDIAKNVGLGHTKISIETSVENRVEACMYCRIGHVRSFVVQEELESFLV